MTTAFFCRTPYHLILSLGLVQKINKDTIKILLIFEDFNNIEIYKKILKKNKTPFNKIIVMNGKKSVKDTPSTYIISRLNLNYIKKMMLKYRFDNIYIYNDSFPVEQYVMFNTHKLKGIINYVEDGSAIYNNNLKKKMPLFVKLISKLIYGDHFNYIRILGSSKYISNIFAFYPSKVRNEIKQQHPNISKLNPDIINNTLNRSLFNTIFDFCNYCQDSYKKCAIIIMPLFSDGDINYTPEIMKHKIYNLIKRLTLNNIKILIKYHPRESNKNTFKNAIIIPNFIPIEIIYLKIGNNKNKLIIGVESTSLITAKLLFGNSVKIVSLYNILYKKKSYLLNKFDIECPDTINNIK